MKLLLVLLVLAADSLAQVPATGKVNIQTSTGNCSPNIVSNGNAPVTVQLLGSCGNVDPSVLTALTQSVQKFVTQFPKTIANLNELLDKKNVELADKQKEIDDWISKFNELSKQLEQQSSDDELSKQAVDALHNGDLQRAESLLKDVLAKEEKQVDLTAQNQFNLAQLLELRFEPLQALSHYQKAYNYRPQNPHYGFVYADFLCRQNNFKEAEPIFENVLKTYRDQAKTNPQKYLPEVAKALNDLGNLYDETRRLKEGADAYAEALQIERKLAKANPQAYLPEVAMMLGNLGVLYKDSQRLEEAAASYIEALQILRELAKANPQAYRRRWPVRSTIWAACTPKPSGLRKPPSPLPSRCRYNASWQRPTRRSLHPTWR